MSFIGVLLIACAVYFAVGILMAIRFIFFVAPRIDPAYQSAPLRVRLFFFPGAVAVWPATLRKTLPIDKNEDGDES